jgi:multidrug efflux system membrane fusion protein
VAAATRNWNLAAADLERFSESAGEELRQPGGPRCQGDPYTATQVQAELARNQTAYTVLQSRTGGRHRLVTAEVGQVVAAGQTVMRLARADTLEVAISIPEARMPGGAFASVRRGQPVGRPQPSLSGERCANCRRSPTR